MTVESGWVPPEIDTTKANSARVYDYWLGGDHNFQADRDAARAAIAFDPGIRAAARANRAFLGRAVRFLAGQAGIRQFLDIGSGLPAENNVHQVARDTAPGSRVVYVDRDDVVVAHSRLMLADAPDAAVIQADLREPGRILADPETQLLLDFSHPVAVLLVGVLHFIPDDAVAAGIVATLRDALVPGSHLVIGHACGDGQPDLAPSFAAIYNSRVDTQTRFRTGDEITRLCEGFTFLDPGLVWIPQWRPDSPGDVPGEPEKYWVKVGVARYDGR
ncbi:MAG: SAM-dependent methyltransferase [Nocardiopsaceae bacterium]|nr:SAM-dependent methyltransferase [Nocardiopsaceae bacterium]